MNEELKFLRWFYHRERLQSGDSMRFERALEDIYTHERGKQFPYYVPQSTGGLPKKPALVEALQSI